MYKYKKVSWMFFWLKCQWIKKIEGKELACGCLSEDIYRLSDIKEKLYKLKKPGILWNSNRKLL